MTAQPYNRFVFVSWSWHLPCNGNQALGLFKFLKLKSSWSALLKISLFQNFGYHYSLPKTSVKCEYAPYAVYS